MRRKRILFVELNQDGTVGGSHICLLNLIRCIDRTLYRPLVMFYEEHKLLPIFSAEACTVQVFPKPLGKRIAPPLSILDIPCSLLQKTRNATLTSVIPFFRFVLFLLRHGIDLVHLNNTARHGWEWLLACRLLKRKCVTHERGFARYGPLARVVARRFDKILCVSHAVMDALEAQGVCENVTTLYDGIDPLGLRRKVARTPEEVRGEFGLRRGDPLIGMVANLQEWKGQGTVLDAVEILRDEFPSLLCLLIGDVSPRNQQDQQFAETLRRQILERNLLKNILLTGYRPDVPDLMNAMDIVLHASIQPEPFGMVVLEAMSLGKPVIATDLGGPKEIIENGVSGLLVPPGDAQALSERISRLLRDTSLRQRLGQNASKRVEGSFSLGGFSQRINSFYQELFSDGHTPADSTATCTRS
jgi:glycosyltransferase involved in cell wall biosynthesis